MSMSLTRLTYSILVSFARVKYYDSIYLFFLSIMTLDETLIVLGVVL